MAEAPKQPDDAQPADAPDQQGARAGDPSASWTRLWQVPAAVGGAGLLAGGLFIATATRPEPNHQQWLDLASRQIEAQRYDDAIATLNARTAPPATDGDLTREQTGLHHVLLGRALYLGQRALQVSVAENHRNILRAFADAEETLGAIPGEDRARRARTLLALDRAGEAFEVATALPDGMHETRLQILLEIAESLDPRRPTDATLALDVLSRVQADARGDDEVRGAAAVTQGEVLIQLGRPGDAAELLLRQLQRLADLPENTEGRVHLTLSRAYLDLDDMEAAGKAVARAERLLANNTTLEPELLLSRGRVRLAEGDAALARDDFGRVVSEFSQSLAHRPALLELAEAEAGLGNHDAARDALSELIDEMALDRPPGSLRARRVRRADISDAALRWFAASLERGDVRRALMYAGLAEAASGDEAPAPRVTLALAEAHRRLADELLDPSLTNPLAPQGVQALGPADRKDARRHLLRAAQGFREYADLVVLDDNAAFGESLFRAADSFDLAGDMPAAARTYQTFINAMPGSPRSAEAVFRLGLVSMAMGDYGAAAEQFRALIAGDETLFPAAGPFADRSHVPLAQCLLLDGRPDNDAEAERLLVSVVNGSVIRDPGPRERRDGLVELGKLYASRGEPMQAAPLFDEAIQRFPDDPALHAVRFRLGGVHRAEADRLRDVLEGSMALSVRERLQSARDAHLNTAFEQYDLVIKTAPGAPGRAAGDPARRPTLEPSELDRAMVRDAYFFRAACAFDLGRLDDAIAFYEAAFDRYADDPGSLIALVQIMNAHVERGDMARARTTNARAKRFFESLPDEVWNDPSLPLSRRDWELWLDASDRLHQADATADARAGAAGDGLGP